MLEKEYRAAWYLRAARSGQTEGDAGHLACVSGDIGIVKDDWGLPIVPMWKQGRCVL